MNRLSCQLTDLSVNVFMTDKFSGVPCIMSGCRGVVVMIVLVIDLSMSHQE